MRSVFLEDRNRIQPVVEVPVVERQHQEPRLLLGRAAVLNPEVCYLAPHLDEAPGAWHLVLAMVPHTKLLNTPP